MVYFHNIELKITEAKLFLHSVMH